jgi:microcystin-dependent protein
MTIVSTKETLTYVSEIIMWAGSVSSYAGVVEPVSGWLLCNGASIAKSNATYANLYASIGVTYGGDAVNFSLPNLSARFAAGGPTFGSRGGSSGASTVTLTAGQTPAHTHTLPSSSTDSHDHASATSSSTELADHYHNMIVNYQSGLHKHGSNPITVGTTISYTGGIAYTPATGIESPGVHTHTYPPMGVDDHTHTITIASAGSGGSHTNLPTYIALHHLIRYF